MRAPRLTAAFPAILLLVQTQLGSAFDPYPFLGPLEPWKVTGLRITAPQEGHSGAVHIEFAIDNPNRVSAGTAPHASGGGYVPFLPSSANCTVGWETSSGATDGVSSIYGNCVETTENSGGVWTADVLGKSMAEAEGRTLFDPRKLDLAFSLTYNITRWGGVMLKVYNGTAHFAVGENPEDGFCSDESGTCEFGLKNGSAPVLVEPTMTACQGTCHLD
ncbi:hypothetical protein AAE478_007727 [Parahypoxylon ruwenzoriense]